MTNARGRPLEIAVDMTFPERPAMKHAGSGVYARSLVEALCARDDLTLRVISGPQREGPAGTLDWLLRGARKQVLSGRPDILHCPAYVTPWRSPVPVIITIHDASSYLFSADFTWEWRLYNRYLLPSLARRAAAVLVPTNTSRVAVMRHYGIRDERIRVTREGVDETYRRRIHGAAASILRRRLSPGHPLILFCGAPLGRKNLDIVLRVMANAMPGTCLAGSRLVISGASESEFPSYRDWIQTRGLRERVLWLGRVPEDEMPVLFSAADVLVYPSLYEGFGLPPLQAMSVGTPVVASLAPCLPEVLGDAALLVDPLDERNLAEALEAVLSNTGLRGVLIARGKTMASQYTWERCATETCAVYAEVAATRER
jgi:glycosyltransferase involved in cell wall biosynthesis